MKFPHFDFALRFGMNQQAMMSPWADNMSSSMRTGAGGNEAKLAMNILNAVLSSVSSSLFEQLLIISLLSLLP